MELQMSIGNCMKPSVFSFCICALKRELFPSVKNILAKKIQPNKSMALKSSQM